MKIIIKYLFLFAAIIFISSCSSTKNIPRYDKSSGKFIETGVASWYGPNFNGKQTANGETFDMYTLTAAHRTLPFNSIVKVVNKSNDKSVVVRINDRGPYAKNRIIDLSKKAAEKIDLIIDGTAWVDLFLLSNTKLPKNLKTPQYTVQIGSFKSETDAQKLSSSIENSKVIKVVISGETYFRVYVGMFESIEDTENLKHFLQNKGINGFVKQVGN